MKGQSFIVEFVLFFGIAFSLFATISFMFFNQSQFLSEQTGDSLSNLINDLVSINVMKGANCKACSNATFTEDIPSRIGGFFYKVEFQQGDVNTTLFSSRPVSQRESIFNLDETFSFSGASNSENKKVEVLINNVNKIIGVG